MRTLHPDFDVEDLASHFDWEFASEFEKDGVLYYVFAECPLWDRPLTAPTAVAENPREKHTRKRPKYGT